MKAKYARLIRIAILSKCIPWIVRPAGYEVLDYERLRQYQYDYADVMHNPLVQKARNRTRSWDSFRNG